jgi:hypothetical protein
MHAKRALNAKLIVPSCRKAVNVSGSEYETYDHHLQPSTSRTSLEGLPGRHDGQRGGGTPARDEGDLVPHTHGHAGISAVMSLRLSAALGTSPEFRLKMQVQHDLWHGQNF